MVATSTTTIGSSGGSGDGDARSHDPPLLLLPALLTGLALEVEQHPTVVLEWSRQVDDHLGLS